MTTLYALLDDTDPDAGQELVDAVTGTGGRLTVFLPPRLAIVDGDDTTADALTNLVGAGLTAVGVDDVTDLAFAADTVELERQVAVLAATTSAADAAAELVRPDPDVDWTGFGCLADEG